MRTVSRFLLMPDDDNQSAVLLLPPGALSAVLNSGLARWLARGDVLRDPRGRDLLARLTAELGAPPIGQGLAALRYWGQTGERPSAWLAAADAVYLEPRLDHLRLHSLAPADILGHMQAVVAELDRSLGQGSSLRFLEREGSGYVRADAEPFATASLSATALDGAEPSRHMPAGEGAARFRKLLSEIEMALHMSPIQAERESAGLRPISGLWLWGGGTAPEAINHRLPMLYGDDALITGYWRAAASQARAWPGSVDACAEAHQRFVAVVPGSPAGGASDAVETARRLLERGWLRKATMLFPEALTITVRRSHRFRFWRGRSVPGPAGEPAE